MESKFSSDEISFKDVLLLFAGYGRLILRNILWILLPAIVVGGVMAYLSYTEPALKEAKMTFLINEDSGGGGVSSILGQLGVVGGGGTEYNLDKVVSLASSKKIAGATLLDSAVVAGESKIIANAIIDVYDLQNLWGEEGQESEIRLSSSIKDDLSRKEVSIFNKLYRIAVKTKEKPLLSIDYDPQTGIFEMKGVSLNDELSLQLVNGWYDRLSDFYIEQEVGNTRRTVINLRAKADSISTLLASTEVELARLNDRIGTIVRNTDRLKSERLYRDVRMYEIMYGEVIKNMETAAFTLNTKAPFFVTIDEPTFPLVTIRPSPVSSFLLSFVIASIFIVTFICFRKLIVDTLQ